MLTKTILTSGEMHLSTLLLPAHFYHQLTFTTSEILDTVTPPSSTVPPMLQPDNAFEIHISNKPLWTQSFAKKRTNTGTLQIHPRRTALAVDVAVIPTSSTWKASMAVV